MKPPSKHGRTSPAEQDDEFGAVARHSTTESNVHHRSSRGRVPGDHTYVRPLQKAILTGDVLTKEQNSELQNIYDTPFYRALAGEDHPSASGNVARSTRTNLLSRTDTPVLVDQERESKVPAPKPKKRTNPKPKDADVPDISQPLSILTRNVDVPPKDIAAWVNRPVQDRMEEAEAKRRIGRPMNAFMLYRSCFAERVKKFFGKDKHQVVSSVCGESWKTWEPAHVKEQFHEWAKIERANHQIAFPEYKFQPSSKGTTKKRRGAAKNQPIPTHDQPDSDGDYVEPRRKRRQFAHEVAAPRPTENVGLDTHPYFEAPPARDTHLGHSQQQFVNTYNPSGNIDLGANMDPSQTTWFDLAQDLFETPVSMPGPHTMNPYSFPDGNTHDEFFEASGNATSAQPRDNFNQRNFNYHHLPSNIAGSAHLQSGQTTTNVNPQQLYAQQQYIQGPNRLPAAIDPRLTVNSASQTGVNRNDDNFDELFRHLADEEETNANTGLGPGWPLSGSDQFHNARPQ